MPPCVPRAQQPCDEITHLKSDSGKPGIKPPTMAPSDRASEAGRQVRTPRGKSKEHAILTTTRKKRCAVDPAELP